MEALDDTAAPDLAHAARGGSGADDESGVGVGVWSQRVEGSASDETHAARGGSGADDEPAIVIGVLALQGAFESHQLRLSELGSLTRQVRTPDDLAGVDALVMPGGESTTMSKLLLTSGLFDPIAERIAGGMPVFGTCAGMILLATEILDGRPDQRSFGAIDITVQRNGYGRQLDSFETELEVPGITGGPFHGVFIRAPKVVRVGADVEVLAEHDGVPVLLRHGPITVASFHPELAGDHRLHAQFLHSFHHAHTESS